MIYCNTNFITSVPTFYHFKPNPTNSHPSDLARFKMPCDSKVPLHFFVHCSLKGGHSILHMYKRPLVHCRKGGLIRGGLLYKWLEIVWFKQNGWSSLTVWYFFVSFCLSVAKWMLVYNQQEDTDCRYVILTLSSQKIIQTTRISC